MTAASAERRADDLSSVPAGIDTRRLDTAQETERCS
jgi:hypothetical protein